MLINEKEITAAVIGFSLTAFLNPKSMHQVFFAQLRSRTVYKCLMRDFILPMRFHTTLGKPAYQDWEKSVVHQN